MLLVCVVFLKSAPHVDLSSLVGSCCTLVLFVWPELFSGWLLCSGRDHELQGTLILLTVSPSEGSTLLHFFFCNSELQTPSLPGKFCLGYSILVRSFCHGSLQLGAYSNGTYKYGWKKRA